jgi:predicted dehydrogenase
MTFGLGSHTIDQALLLFGPPTRITGFQRTHRGIESETEDSFTAVLEYGKQPGHVSDGLLVTVKTLAVSALKDQIKYIARGTKGSYIKYGSCIQEIHVLSQKPTDQNFGVEPESLWGNLTTKGSKAFDEKYQTYDKELDLWTGKIPTEKGHWLGYYETLRDALNGKTELAVKPEQSRDGIRVIELIRESSQGGKMVNW